MPVAKRHGSGTPVQQFRLEVIDTLSGCIRSEYLRAQTFEIYIKLSDLCAVCKNIICVPQNSY